MSTIRTTLSLDEYQASLTRLRVLLQQENSVQWAIGDLIIEMTREDDEKNTGLREIAAQVNRTEGVLSTWRKVAARFPPDARKYDVPWIAYRNVLKEEEFAEPALQRYVEKATLQPPKRPFSTSLLRDSVLEIRKEAEAQPLTLQLSYFGKFRRQVMRCEDRVRRGKEVPSVDECDLVIKEMESLLSVLRPWINNRRRHGG